MNKLLKICAPSHVYHLPLPRRLRLEITHCTGLAKADRFGLSDPFCVVLWQNNELGRTPTIHNTIRPVWKSCSFELPLEVPTELSNSEGDGIGGKMATPIDNKGRSRTPLTGGQLRDREMRSSFDLVLQVWDEDDGEASDFLGELRFEGDALLEMAKNHQKMVRCIVELKSMGASAEVDKSCFDVLFILRCRRR